MRGAALVSCAIVAMALASPAEGIGVSWEEMRGFYPDDVFRFIPISAFGR